MKVKLYECRKGVSYGNIMWCESHPARHGRFPKSHPAAPSRDVFGYGTVFSRDDQPKDDPSPLGRFRALGYYASCFPEGDGLCFAPPEGVTIEQTAQHVHECFGWEPVLADAGDGATVESEKGDE